jgi:prepilin-type processing-associated H-X9-DG protein
MLSGTCILLYHPVQAVASQKTHISPPVEVSRTFLTLHRAGFPDANDKNMLNFRRRELAAILVTVVIIAGLAGLRARYTAAESHRSECYANLKQISSDWHSFFVERGNFLTEISTNAGGTKELTGDLGGAYNHFRALVTFVSINTNSSAPINRLVCPIDSHIPASLKILANTNLSYFLSVNASPGNGNWILSGNRNIRRNNYSPAKEYSWNPRQGLHGNAGYILFLDGSVSSVDDVGLAKFFSQNGNETNLLSIP